MLQAGHKDQPARKGGMSHPPSIIDARVETVSVLGIHYTL